MDGLAAPGEGTFVIWNGEGYKRSKKEDKSKKEKEEIRKFKRKRGRI